MFEPLELMFISLLHVTWNHSEGWRKENSFPHIINVVIVARYAAADVIAQSV